SGRWPKTRHSASGWKRCARNSPDKWKSGVESPWKAAAFSTMAAALWEASNCRRAPHALSTGMAGVQAAVLEGPGGLGATISTDPRPLLLRLRYIFRIIVD